MPLKKKKRKFANITDRLIAGKFVIEKTISEDKIVLILQNSETKKQ